MKHAEMEKPLLNRMYNRAYMLPVFAYSLMDALCFPV